MKKADPCPRCGRPARELLEEPIPGHEVREGETWKPAPCCIKCVDEIRAGKKSPTPARASTAANDNNGKRRPAKRRPMVQLDMFEQAKTNERKGSR